MTSLTILRVVSKLLIPLILLFAFYVQFHGDYGLRALRRVAPPPVIEFLIAFGLLLYAGVGVATMVMGGNFLGYNALDHHDPVHGQHLGILLVELGVGITVAAVMMTIYTTFAARNEEPQ